MSAEAERPSATSLEARLGRPGDCVGVVGPAGAGKSRLLAALVERRVGLGQRVVRGAGRRFEELSYAAFDRVVTPPVGRDDAGADGEVRRGVEVGLLGGGLLVVDDAQWLDAASLRVVASLAARAEEGGWQVLVATRPVRGHRELAGLHEVLVRTGPLVRLGPLGRDELAALASERLRAPATEELVEVLERWSGGWPAWAERLLTGWAEEGIVVRGQLRRDPAGRLPDAVVELVEARLAALDAAERAALVRLSLAHADGDADAAADAEDAGSRGGADAPDGHATEALAGLGAAALLDRHGRDPVPAVAVATLLLVPRAEQHEARRHLAREASARPGGALAAARHLRAAGATDAEARAGYTRAGEVLAPRDPVAALVWFEVAAVGSDGAVDAEAAGAAGYGRLAEALAAAGRGDDALVAAETALRRGGTEADRARLAAAAVLAERGLWSRAAELSGEVTGHPGAGPALARAQHALCLAVAGRVDEARAVAAGLAGATSTGLAERALVATAVALIDSLEPQGHRDGVATLVEAATLFESAPPAVPLALVPHEVAAALALASGDAVLAGELARRAARALALPLPRRARLLLVAGWAAMRQGNAPAAEEALTRASAALSSDRDRVLAAGLEAGLARRDGDVPRQAAVVEAVAGLLGQVAPDLLLLDALGELGVLLRRFGHADKVGGAHRSAGALLAELGSPPVWALPHAWAELAAAAAVPDPVAAAGPAADVVRLAPGARRLEPLGGAALAWRTVLEGEVDVAAVDDALAHLARVGLAWEASQLAGQAAIRVRDPLAARRLLTQARSLRPATPGAPDELDEAQPRTSPLSDQERKVARLVVDGLTHKEIGAQLYISPKTVEHHVARMRQKLAAGSRAEMLAALRRDLGETGSSRPA